MGTRMHCSRIRVPCFMWGCRYAVRRPERRCRWAAWAYPAHMRYHRYVCETLQKGGPVSCALYSDNQADVDALARRIVALTSFSSEQAASVAFSLLCRKVLKIKSGALAQLFKSVNADVDTKRMRDEFLKSGLIVKIEGTGLGGRPAVYRICADVAELPEEPADERESEAEPELEAAADTEGEFVEAALVAEEKSEREAELEADEADEIEVQPAEEDEVDTAPEVEAEVPAAPVIEEAADAVAVESASESEPESAPAPEAQGEAQPKKKPRARQRRHRASEGERKAEQQHEKQPEQQPEREHQQQKQRIEQAQQGKRSKKKRATDGQASAASVPEPAPRRDPEPVASPDSSKRPSPVAIARVLGRRIAGALPKPAALAKVREKRAEIVRVPHPQMVPAEEARPRATHSNSAKSQTAGDFAAITAWIDQAHGMDVPYASRRQRAFEIFNDEKAFDGKRGERLFKRLNDRGVNVSALKITPQRASHFSSFYGIGADKPFIVVENIDTYEEIVRLLRGNSSTKLFGVRVSGVIFGGGCKVNIAHALDDFLADIGYRYDYVYYAGDIDREGARIVEQARAANNVKIRLHAGMYRAMLAAHGRRVKEGKTVEPASQNQGVPQNLARAIDDLPMVTRVQFRNVLRQGGRIPQEILTSADYRDSSSGPVERLLNK